MPNEVLYILFIAMVAVIMVNIVCAVDHKKAEKSCEKWEETYYSFIVCGKKKFWEELGAYSAEKEGYMYVDVPGGARLIIFENKIDGWYIP